MKGMYNIDKMPTCFVYLPTVHAAEKHSLQLSFILRSITISNLTITNNKIVINID